MPTDNESSARPSASSSPSVPASPGPELRLLDRRAFVGFPPLPIAPGVSVVDFALQIPDVSFPFSFTGGAARFQRRKLQFGFLELEVAAEELARRVLDLQGRLTELDGLKLHFRPGYLEAQARLAVGERAPVTFKLAFDGDGDRLAVYVYDVRLYGFTTTPAARVPVLVAEAAKGLELLPELEVRGASGLSARVLPALVELAAVGRGYRMPSLDQARLAGAEVTGKGLRLRFASGGLPPPAAPDEELLLSLEGARAFAEAEGLLAEGRLAEARDAYLRHGDLIDAHPFAVERLLTLLVADPQAHELALDVAQNLGQRRARSATALWAEAIVRERRGESARAAERWLALCALARRNQEEASAFFAAESAARAARDQAPQMAVRALHEVLGIRPDHLPSLKALARAADAAQDRAGAIRAFRRIAALARDPMDAAEAHVQLARLCALTEDDIAGARLHCEAALKLSPNHPDALYQLGELCHRSGDHLRAIKALDRLREVAMGRHEVDRIGRAAVLAGRVWEEGLAQPENALLRYREAASLLPGEAEPLFLAARVADGLGKVQEAVSGYLQAIELAGPAPREVRVREVAHAAHHAMARLSKVKLGEPARAREHLEAALGLDPRDLLAIEELLPYFRAEGRAEDLADALENAAAVIPDRARRAALWAEAGELYRGRLANPERAEQLLTQALESDPTHRGALEGLLALAETQRDGRKLCRSLRGLAELEAEPTLRARHLRRLAVAARDLSSDLELAAAALGEVLSLEPSDLAAWGELCALQRRRGDMDALAFALERRAQVAEAQGDVRLAAAALRELSNVLEARLGRVAEALVALERAAQLAPDPAYLFELADLALRCDRPERARRALEALLAHLPKSAAPDKLAEVHARLGRACELCGDAGAAKEHYAQAFPLRRTDDALAARLEALFEASGESLRLSELWATRAQALLELGRADESQALFLRSGHALLALGEVSAAMLRFTAALEAAPQSASAGEVLEAMGELELRRGARRDAARLFARRAELHPQDRAAARLFARAAELLAGDPREETLWGQALERDPHFAPARLRRAELRREGDPQGALEDLQTVLALDATDPEAPNDAQRPELMLAASRAAAAVGDLDTARALLSEVTAQRPDDVALAQELAALHRRAGAKDELRALLSELWRRLDPFAARPALREYAELCLEAQQVPQTREALRALLQLEPRNLWAAANLLALLEADAAEAERLLLLGLLIESAEGPSRAQLLVTRAALHRGAGRLEDARADLERALPDAEERNDVAVELGAVLAELGDGAAELRHWRSVDGALALGASARLFTLSESEELAEEAFALLLSLALTTDDRARAARGAAELALAKGDRDGAVAALEIASAHGPTASRVDAALLRARLLEEDGHIEDASSAYALARSLAPANATASDGLLRTLEALERWEEVARLRAGNAAIRTGAAAAREYLLLGTVLLERLGREDEALTALRRAGRVDPADVASRRHLHAVLVRRDERVEAAAVLEQLSALVESPSEIASEFRALAHRAREVGSDDEALRLLRRAHELSPATSRTELAPLAELLYLKGAVAEALPLHVALCGDEAEAAAALASEDAQLRNGARTLHLRLADLAEGAGDLALAERALRRVLQSDPQHAVAAERLSAVLAPRDPRAAVEVLWAWARELTDASRAVPVLQSLAEKARTRLMDWELASAILRRVAELSPTRASHEALAELFRESGRVPELMSELLVVADLALAEDDLEGAISAFEEEARLCESAGRHDAALKTLQALRELCEDEGQPERAAKYELRRAELFRDVRLDAVAAESALEKAWSLWPSLQLARAGEAMARRRDDAHKAADWLARSLPLVDVAADRARVLLELARLFAGPIGANPQSEQAAREALQLDPSLEEARALLVRALERDGRVAELAAHHEELAAAATAPDEKVRLFLEAARIYRDRAGQPDAAAAAVLGARAVKPDDEALTLKCADLLHEAGRTADAAEFDALLLETNPFHPSAYERHRAHLEKSGEWAELAGLLLRRAERLTGGADSSDAAEAYLAAASCLRRVGGSEQALLCEERAFEVDPRNRLAFEAVRARAADVRRAAEVLARRAQAVPEERAALLTERADALWNAGEALLAAAALDELLLVAPEEVPALERRAELAFEAGGAKASQPWDRRLLQTAGERLAPAVRVRTQLRLGHAALSGGALVDAADAFETVVALDPDGERGAEALSLLSEVHARSGDREGLFRTTLRLAQRATAKGAAEEAEALLRRAAELAVQPEDAVEALVPLARLRPSEVSIVERAAAGLKSLGRPSEAVELYERGAQAVGGARAAAWLLAAAGLVAEPKGELALSLRERAAAADPQNTEALRALCEAYRQLGQMDRLGETLKRLAEIVTDEDERAVLLLERGELAARSGDVLGARAAFDAIIQRGSSGAGYLQALDALIPLLEQTGEGVALAEALLRRGAVCVGGSRGEDEARAARVLMDAGEPERALRAARAALAAKPTAERHALVAELCEALGEDAGAARAWREAGELLRGVDAYVRAGLTEEALEWMRAAADELIESADGDREVRAAELAARFERFGQLEDALRMLGQAEETPERLLRRAQWAERLGRTGEALQLRERCAGDDPKTLEELAVGYARAALVPFAVRLAERLQAAGHVFSEATRRELAERLSSTPDGAAFALTLWPGLLRERPVDADGWTLFAEALHACGRHEAAVMADGFGAALTGSSSSAPAAPWARLEVKRVESELPAPARLAEITAESMPRLHAALAHALSSMGAERTRVFLDPHGGVEAWLLAADELVIGAGALGAFGPVELGWLCALALTLGEESRAFTRVGEGQGPDFAEAAARAFEAHPATLAACRVIAQLDDRVRGMDPLTVEVARVLRESPAFHAIARRAVELV